MVYPRPVYPPRVPHPVPPTAQRTLNVTYSAKRKQWIRNFPFRGYGPTCMRHNPGYSFRINSEYARSQAWESLD